MNDLLNKIPLWQIFSAEYTAHLLRYLGIGGLTFLFFYAWKRQCSWAPKIQAHFPPGSEMRREFLYSLISIAIFSLTGVGMFLLRKMGYTQLYFRLGWDGLGYVALSSVALILAHDAYFYWTHRLMHWRPLFPIVHRIHHLSHTPTPWAAFAFHPIEAFVQAAFFPIIAFVLPVHPLAVIVWLTYMTVMNVLGHCGFEILPRGFATNRFFKWHNTTTHHDMHHRFVRHNYGLYFNIWDRLMGTNHQNYEAEFERLKGRTEAASEKLSSASHGAA